MPAIGIDLGTSNSCVAVYRNGQTHIIQNDQGSRLTPSLVQFTEHDRLIGDAAKSSLSSDFEDTIYQIKRLIGRTYDDPVVQDDIKTLGYKVINDKNKPLVRVSYKKKVKSFTPEAISAMILESLKQTAEDFMGKPVTDAIITVPAHFNDAQRSATRDAGKIAGLNVLRMINEPTAAAIAYGIETKEKQNILIFDLGGGTFDVTIVNIEDNIFDVKATGGDTHLGGNDFDNRLTDYFIKEFNKANKCDMSEDKHALSRLRVQCEIIKKQLSSGTSAKLNIDGLYKGKDLKSTIMRVKFEELNSDLFKNTIKIVKKTLSDAGMKAKNISKVVLVGGSTRIPKIQQLLKKHFEGKILSKTINVDEAVAYGAGVLAAKLSGDTEIMSDVKEIDLRDVLPLSVGWRSRGDRMNIVLRKNTKIPITDTDLTPATTVDNQTKATFYIYEGERACVKHNHLLGSFSLHNIPPKPKNQEKFSLCFAIDESGILTVSARNTSSGEENQIVISNNRGRLSAKEIDQMREEAEKFRKEDEEFKARNKARNILEDYVYAIKHSVDNPDFQGKMSEQHKINIFEKCTEILNWAKIQEDPEIDECEKKKIELKNLCRPIFAKLPGGEAHLQTL
ncbi:heat shock cognate 71 kDa protein-like [Styela clava]